MRNIWAMICRREHCVVWHRRFSDNNNRLEMDSTDGKYSWSFNVRDAVQAKEIMGLWEKLKKVGK